MTVAGAGDLQLTPEDLAVLRRKCARLFTSERAIRRVLGGIGFPPERVPLLSSPWAEEVWDQVFDALAFGAPAVDPYRGLLDALVREYPRDSEVCRLQRTYLARQHSTSKAPGPDADDPAVAPAAPAPGRGPAPQAGPGGRRRWFLRPAAVVMVAVAAAVGATAVVLVPSLGAGDGCALAGGAPSTPVNVEAASAVRPAQTASYRLGPTARPTVTSNVAIELQGQIPAGRHLVLFSWEHKDGDPRTNGSVYRPVAEITRLGCWDPARADTAGQCRGAQPGPLVLRGDVPSRISFRLDAALFDDATYQEYWCGYDQRFSAQTGPWSRDEFPAAPAASWIFSMTLPTR